MRGEPKLTKAMLEFLALLAEGPRTGITDDRIARELEGRDLAFHFYESDGGSLEPVWTITESGRQWLSRHGGDNA